VTRVAIVARSSHAAEEIAGILSDEERLEVVDVRISPRFVIGHRGAMCDVVLAIGLPEFETPQEGPSIVALTDTPVPAFPSPHSPHAVLPLHARNEEIIAALVAAASGLFVLTTDQAAKAAGQPVLRDPIHSTSEKLTLRELEVLRMLADGLANKEIAQALGVSDHTVKFHVSQILAKLSAASRTEAVTAGIRAGLLSI
jgi:DNA-binding CsgD family transcriptional regulator